jgi:hypothetical protein
MGMDARKRSLQSTLKITRKSVVTQLCLLVFNVFGVAFNAYWAYKAHGDPSVSLISCGIGIGAFLSNGLWTLAIICRDWGDISIAKDEIRYIEQIEIREEIDEDKKMYAASKKNFDTIVAGYQMEMDRLRAALAVSNKIAESELNLPSDTQ